MKETIPLAGTRASGLVSSWRSKRASGAWRKVVELTIYAAFCTIIIFAWASPEFNQPRPADWKRTVLMAFSMEGKEGSLLKNHYLAKAARIASRNKDWKGMIIAACAMTRSDKAAFTPASPTRRTLVGASIAAERTKSRTGIYTVADAFESLGDPVTASQIVSRIQPDWPYNRETESAKRHPWRCDEQGMREALK